MNRIENIVDNNSINNLWMSGDSIPFESDENLCSCGFDIKQTDSEYCFDCVQTKKSPISSPKKNSSKNSNVNNLSDMEI